MVFRRDEKMLFAMPGVPYEMKIAMNEQILPYILRQTHPQNDIIHRTILVSGISESALALRIEAWENALPKTIHLAYLPKDGTIRLRLSTYGEASAAEVDEQQQRLMPLIHDYVVETDDIPLEVHLGELLKSRHQTIATAESCTGGKLATLLNKHAGSSAFYFGSVVAYDNSVKHNVLGVGQENLNTYGAVSEQVVREMAEGVRRLCRTDYAIATSGIAGPDGGTAEKPVGTVWIAWATPNGTFAECFQLGRLREQITDRACTRALIRLLQIMEKGE